MFGLIRFGGAILHSAIVSKLYSTETVGTMYGLQGPLGYLSGYKFYSYRIN